MPANILYTDRLIPRPDGKTQAEFNREVTDCFMLLCEQLRYTLSCLGVNNFNAAAFDELARRLGVDKKQDALTGADGAARLASAGDVGISAGDGMTLSSASSPGVDITIRNGVFLANAGSEAYIGGTDAITLESASGEIHIKCENDKLQINAARIEIDPGNGGMIVVGDLMVTGSVTPNYVP